jgi:sarcosine oxidase subunit alpha
MNRLANLPTLRIKPQEQIPFTYRGKSYTGVAGDTVATALFANRVRIFGRSLKYHRPRGLYSLDGVCSNTCMAIDGVPNVHAEVTPLRAGMTVRPQNVLGSPEWDMLGFMDRLDWAMPAGFYYRTMHKPANLWPFFRKWIRRAAGLGKLDPAQVMTGRYDEIYPQTDVCVIGGGPAGMSAALAATDFGLRVLLLEARPFLGGFYDYRTIGDESKTPFYRRASKAAQTLREKANIRILNHTSVIGIYNNNLVTARQIGHPSDSFDERYVEVRARSLVVATGCIERPLLFEHNERPGVMQAGCAHRLARTYGILPGKNVVFSVGDDLGLEAAVDLAEAGVQVLAVADCRMEGYSPRLLEELARKNIPFLPGWVAAKAHGKKHVRRVTLISVKAGGRMRFECDLLVASAGQTPVNGPLSLAHAKLGYDDHTGFFLPEELPPRIYAAGRMLGLQRSIAIETSGQLAGLRAARDCGADIGQREREAADRLQELGQPAKGSKLVMAPVKGRKSFVCFDEDCTVKNVRQACDMGFDQVELAKRFTAAGTGPGQSGIPGHNLPLLITRFRGYAAQPSPPSVVRAPLAPTLLATYAGAKHDAFKRTPVHDVQQSTNAVFRRIGDWKRVRYYSQDFSSREEIENVRNNVGMIEVATLGKFRLFGPDALRALQRVYVGNMAHIPAGKAKYSAMCNDVGCLVDDGVVVQRGESDYYLTTSTARAGMTVQWIRYHTRYDGWNFHLVNRTDAFGAINLAGPNSRAVLANITDADLSNEAFPFMGYREFLLAGKIPARVMRLGFVGELSYEIHMPASMMAAVWNLLLEAGNEFGIRPFGLEAQNCLRLEKGHVIIGQESEIRTTLHDLGLGFLWYRDKKDAKTIGAVALGHTQQQPGRLKLVGLETQQPSACPKDGSLIVDGATPRGHVCTARYSFTLQKSIALALLDSSLATPGTQVSIFEPSSGGKRTQATVVPTPFYDPEGKRQRM